LKKAKKKGAAMLPEGRFAPSLKNSSDDRITQTCCRRLTAAFRGMGRRSLIAGFGFLPGLASEG